MAILFALRFMGYLFPTARLWGVNHLIFLPDWFAVVYAAAGVAILIAYYLKPVQKAGEIVIDRFNNIFFEQKHRVRNQVIRALVCGIVFAIFAMPTHFLGDGYMQINNLGTSHFVIHKWSELGITYATSMVQSLLGERSVANARLAFQIVSVISGAVTVYFMLLIAGELGEDKPRRLLGLAALAFSGVLLLFFGYAETYPLLWIWLSGFFFFALKYINTGRGLYRAVLFFVLGLFIHLYLIVFIPALIALALSGKKGRRYYSKYRWAIWIAALVVLVAGGIILAGKIRSNLAVENIFLWPFSGKPVDESYFIFSPSHLLDMLNLSLLVSPVLIIFVYLAGRDWKNAMKKPHTPFLVLAAIGSFGFLLVIDPQLALARDWDLMSPSFFALTLLALLLIPSKKLAALSGRPFCVAVMAGLLVLPYLVTNLVESSSVRYFKYIIDMDINKSISSVIVLRTYYDDLGNKQAVDSMNVLYARSYPDAVLLGQAMSALEKSDGQKASAYLARVKPNKFLAGYHNILGGVYYLRGAYKNALEESDMAMQLEPYNSTTHCDRSMIFAGMKMYDSAQYWLESSYRLYDGNPFVLGSLAWLHFRAHNYDSSEFYARKLVSLNEYGGPGNYWLAKLSAVRRDRTGFEKYFEAYRRDGVSDESYQNRVAELGEIAKALEKIGTGR